MRSNICSTLLFSFNNQRLNNEEHSLSSMLIRLISQNLHTALDKVILNADFVLGKVMIEAVVDFNQEVNCLLDNWWIDALKSNVPNYFKFIKFMWVLQDLKCAELAFIFLFFFSRRLQRTIAAKTIDISKPCVRDRGDLCLFLKCSSFRFN